MTALCIFEAKTMNDFRLVPRLSIPAGGEVVSRCQTPHEKFGEGVWGH